jgi:flagellar motility protein MotE (MotC chaperone)
MKDNGVKPDAHKPDIPGKKTADNKRKEKKPRKSKSGLNKKPKHKIGAACIVAAIVTPLFLITAAGITLCYFNVGGIGAVAIQAFQANISKEVSGTAGALAQQEAMRKSADEKAAAEQEALDSQKERLLKEQADLEKEKQALADGKTELEEQKAALEGRKADIENTAKILAKMDAAKAAEIISGMKNVQEMLRILSRMSVSKAADVIAHMDTALATEITSSMMD